MIVRLSGTNAELGMKMLKESGLKMEVCLDAEEAAEHAVIKSGISENIQYSKSFESKELKNRYA